MKPVSDQTMMYSVDDMEPKHVGEAIVTIYQALKEKGYNPINQMVGYLLSGDPAYITSYRNARLLIRKFGREEILEELVGTYLKDR